MSAHTVLLHTAAMPKEQTAWGSLSWALSGQLGNSATMTFGRVVIRTGCSNPAHRHGNCDEVLYLLSGELDHFAEDLGRVSMAPGDAISIPAGVSHHAVCTSPDDAEMIVVYSAPERHFEPT